MQLAFFEDECAADLHPLTLTRPTFELLCGQMSLRERLVRHSASPEWGAFLRPSLADVYRETYPEAWVNDGTRLQQAPTLLVNGRWLPTAEAWANVGPDEAGVIDDTVVSLILDPLEAPLLDSRNRHDSLAQVARTRRLVQAGGRLIRRPWDLVEHNPAQLAEDFYRWRTPPSATPDEATHGPFGPQVEVLGSTEDVFVAPSAQLDPFVVLDARRGPIHVDADAVIGSFTKVEGPAFIGRGSRLFRALIREGTTVGPVCRVGGEVEASILHGFVNKYHDGFLGHAYVCPWCNLGALTTNSDLKNDYSTVRVPLAGVPVETGHTKVGCFLGDHTKTALGSLFNTGSSVGVMCMLLPGGELLPKHIPSFSRLWHGELIEEPDLDRQLATARTVMARRDRELTQAQEQLYRRLFEQTREERDHALQRAQRMQQRAES